MPAQHFGIGRKSKFARAASGSRVREQAGGFAFLASVSSHTSWPYPTTEADWLHLAEDVHMKLFVAMVFYFVLIARIAAGGTRRIRRMEHCRLGRFHGLSINAPNAPRLIADAEQVKEHATSRKYFIGALVRLREESPDLFEDLLDHLGLDARDIDFKDKFEALMDKELPHLRGSARHASRRHARLAAEVIGPRGKSSARGLCIVMLAEVSGRDAQSIFSPHPFHVSGSSAAGLLHRSWLAHARKAIAALRSFRTNTRALMLARALSRWAPS